MTREEVFALISAHLADELEIDPARIDETTRFRADLEADSLDLYTLVQELEDSYGVKMPDEEAAKIDDGRPGGRLRPRARPRPRADRALKLLTALLKSCPSTCTGRSSRMPHGPSGARTPTRAWRFSETASSASR